MTFVAWVFMDLMKCCFVFLLVTPQMITILYVGYVEAQIGSVSGPPLSLQASYG
jgi:hypothetical protein